MKVKVIEKEENKITEEKEQNNQKEIKDKNKSTSNIKWFIQIFIITFILSIVFSFVSTNGVSGFSMVPAIIVLFVVILIGVLFDIVGVAVTVANEEEFHAKATKKVRGSKTSIKLIKNAPRVANICADVVGDICGVLSGTMGALIALKITQQLGLSFDIQFLISALVAAITVSGKAMGKVIAVNNSTQIVHIVGLFLNKFNKKK